MQFNTLAFFIFFSVCVGTYYSVPVKNKKWLLLVYSVCFYSCFSYSAVIGLVTIAFVSWIGGKVLERVKKKIILMK